MQDSYYSMARGGELQLMMRGHRADFLEYPFKSGRREPAAQLWLMFIAAMPALTHEIASVAFGGRGLPDIPVFCIVSTQTAGITEGQATLWPPRA
ncbi:MAG: hypothetical protein ACLR4Z_01515 [Butyricicoccaceae bacterium]